MPDIVDDQSPNDNKQKRTIISTSIYHKSCTRRPIPLSFAIIYIYGYGYGSLLHVYAQDTLLMFDRPLGRDALRALLIAHYSLAF